MMRYNINTNKVDKLPNSFVKYSEEQLVEQGLYPCIWMSKPDERYYDCIEQSVFENGVYTTIYTATLKPLTPRQLRLQLLAIELLDEVEALCSADRAMSIWFEYSLDFQRSHPMIEAMAVQLGLTQDDMDNFFIEAVKL